MAIFGSDFERDMAENNEQFKNIYDLTIEKFIDSCTDPVIMDLTDKVLVSIACSSHKNIPSDILTIFIPETKTSIIKQS